MMKFTVTYMHPIIEDKGSKSSNMERRKPNDHFLSETLLLSAHHLTTFFHNNKPADGASVLEMRHRQPSLHAVRMELVQAGQHPRAQPGLQARQAHRTLSRIVVASLVWRQEKSECMRDEILQSH